MKKSKFWKKNNFQNHGTKKNGFPSQFAIKITMFWGKKIQNCFKNHCSIFALLVVVWECLILPSLWKRLYSEKTKFSTTIRPKKMDSPLNLLSKSLCFGQKIFFQNFWKNWSKLCLFWSKKWKNKENDIKTAGSVFFKEVWL